MCGAPATTVGYLDPGQINNVTIDGYIPFHYFMCTHAPFLDIFMCCCYSLSVNSSLTPGKEYLYQVGDENGWSEMYQFRASPGPDPSTTTRIIAYGGTLYLYI